MGNKRGKRSANKKKSKLLNREKNEGKSSPDTPPRASHSCETKSPDNKGVLYRRYKAATKAVIQWALDNNSDVDSPTANAQTLSSIVTTLHTLADSCTQHHKQRTITIPPKILSQLETAIRLRRKVSHLYLRLMGKEDYDGHAWIIDQLQAVYEKFRVVSEKQQPGERLSRSGAQREETKDPAFVEKSLSGFAALTLDDDGEDDEEAEASLEEQKPVAVPKTEAERQADRELKLKEERKFALVCTLIEIEQRREHIRELWKEWATNSMNTVGATVDWGELVGVTCASQYSCRLVRTAVARTCVEFNISEEVFLRVVNTIGVVTLQKGCRVSYVTTEGGVVVNTQPEKVGHIMVQPDDSETSLLVPIMDLRLGTEKVAALQEGQRVEWYSRRYATVVSMEAKVEGDVLVKTDGSESLEFLPRKHLIVQHDELWTALVQVYHELETFDFSSVPDDDDDEGLNKALAKTEDDFFDMLYEVVRGKDRAAFVSIALKKFLPAWVAFSDFGPVINETDTLFRQYLREFSTTRVVTLHLCFSLVTLIDSCIVCMEKSTEADPTFSAFQAICAASTISAASTSAMYTTLMDVCGKTQQSVDFFVQDLEPNALADITRNRILRAASIAKETAAVWHPSTNYFPWMAGEYMMFGLVAHAFASHPLPMIFWRSITICVHVYSMLRREGLIGRISALEEPLIRLYRKPLWFRCGVPQKGKYLSSCQISLGFSTYTAPQSTGKIPFRARNLDFEGMEVAHAFDLMNILEFQPSRSFRDKELSSADIKAMVQYECEALLVQPILGATLLAKKLDETLDQRLFHKVSESPENLHFAPWCRVALWALGLADGHGTKDAMQEGLALVAQCYAEVFSDPSCLLPGNKSTFTEFEFRRL